MATMAKELERDVAKEIERELTMAKAFKARLVALAARVPIEIQNAVAEYLAMTLFVIIGCGSAMGIANVPGSAWVLQVSLSFGLAITALAYTVGASSGGHINCAVTFGLVLAGACPPRQGVANCVGQLLGSVTGALLLHGMIPESQDKTGGLGANGIGSSFSVGNALLGEALMTYLLMITVLHTAVSPKSKENRSQAAIAIGFAVFLAHTVLIPIDGCSINPTRSFGPALVARLAYGKETAFDDFWVFVVAPLLGAGLAGIFYYEEPQETVPDEAQPLQAELQAQPQEQPDAKPEAKKAEAVGKEKDDKRAAQEECIDAVFASAV